MKRTRRLAIPLGLLSVLLGILVSALGAQPSAAPAPARASPLQPTAVPAAPSAELPPQTVLVPGLYLFQTRTREGSCNDAPRTGYITSAVATLDGVPGARALTMQLSSKYWPTWALTVHADGTVIGSANLNGAKDGAAGSSRFEIRTKKDRLQGVGAREYPAQVNGKGARCTLHYDALLKPLD